MSLVEPIRARAADEPNGTVFTFDPNARQPHQDMSSSLASKNSSLEAWFPDWIAGVSIWDLMFPPDEERARERLLAHLRASPFA